MEHNYLTKMDKATDFVGSAIKYFVFHLSLNPADFDCWVSLGNAYAYKSYEFLSCGIDDASEKSRVFRLQTAAFNCFLRATKIIDPRSVSALKSQRDTTAATMFGNFAQLIQTMVSAPMGKLHCPELGETNSKLWSQNGLKGYRDRKSMFHHCILNLAKLSIQIENTNWVNYYRISYVYRKLRCEPGLVMKLLTKALELAPKELSVGEYDSRLEIIYKGCSYLLKYYTNNDIDEIDAKQYLKSLITLHASLFEIVSEKNTMADSMYSTIEGVLRAIQVLDKRKWIHKSFYRLSIILDIQFNDVGKAKEEMIAFLNARSKTGFRKIWRTELEL